MNVGAGVYAYLDTPLALSDSSGATTFNIGAGGYSGRLRTSSPLRAIAISGANQLVLNGTGGGGMLELASPNTYSGATSVQAGTLQIDASASIASTSISVSAGATLQLAGTTAALAEQREHHQRHGQRGPWKLRHDGHGDANRRRHLRRELPGPRFQ